MKKVVRGQEDLGKIMTKSSILNRVVRTNVLVSLLLVVMLQMVGIGNVSLSQAANIDCDQLLSKEVFKEFDREKIKKIQESLDVLGYDPKGIDGIIGPETIGALKRFCVGINSESTKKNADNLVEILFHYADEYPAWKKIILSDDFELWMNKQSADRRTEMDKIRKSGTPQQIISLLESYATDGIQNSQLETSNEFVVSFKLTEDDLDKLKTGNECIKQLQELQDVEYASQNELINALKTKVKDSTDQCPSLIVENAEKQTTCKLTDQSFNRLKAEGIPDNILEKLQELQDVEYANKDDSKKAVKKKIDDLKEHYKLLIWIYAEKPRTYTLSDLSFNELEKERKAGNIPDDLFEKILKIKDWKYTSSIELENVVITQIQELAEEYQLLILEHAEELTVYTLNDQSFDNLRAENIPDKLIEKLLKLKGPYLNKNDFVEEVTTEIKGVTDNYLPLIKKHAQKIIIYRLNSKSFKKLKDKNIPDDLLDKLRKVSGKWYFNKNKFKNAVKTKIQELADKYQSLILENAQKPTMYKLTDQSFKKLKNEPMVEKIADNLIEKLRELPDRNYRKIEFEKVVKAKIQELAEIQELADEYQSLILKHAQKPTMYKLTDQSFKELKDKKIPDTIIEKLLGLQDVEYTEKKEFIAAVEKEIDEVIDPYLSLIVEDGYEQATYTLSEEFFNELKKETISENVLEKLQKLQDAEYENQNLFEQALNTIILSLIVQDADEQTTRTLTEEFFNELKDKSIGKVVEELKAESKNIDWVKIDTLIEKYPLIVKQAEKKHRFDESDKELKKIQWVADSCGCVLDDLSGIVYGFYPFWMAGEEQQLDFSVLSRIGYYGLSFDENGDIIDPLHWRAEQTEFIKNIKKARDYKTKMDLVIYKKDWGKWSQFTDKEKSRIIDNATTNIVNLVNIELTGWWRMKRRIFSLGTYPVPTMGNGVTIYFDGYLKEDAFYFIEFIKELRKKLNDAGKSYYLNIMLPMNAIGGNIYSHDFFKKIIPENGKNYVDYLLVFIEEPTIKTKKKLRNAVEKLFTGKERRTMLRKIVPVTTPDGHNEQQLDDDLIYFEDNFGGVGFWPLPTSKESGAGVINSIKRNFRKDETPDNEKLTLLENVTDFLNKNVCPNRWGIRIIFDGLLLTILIFDLCLWVSCKFRYKFRVFFMQYFWTCMFVSILFIFLFFSTGLALLNFDPYYKWNSLIYIFPFIFILFNLYIILWQAYMKRRQRDLP